MTPGPECLPALPRPCVLISGKKTQKLWHVWRLS